MGRFSFSKTPLDGVYHIEPKPIEDDRGYFERLFCEDDFKEIGFYKKIVNINHSYTKQKGSVRGLHFQYPPFSETKIVFCIKGSILDIAVDIRASSPTFLKHHSQVLTSEKRDMLFMPEGFAHGFQTLEDDVELLYLHTNFYDKNSEGAINILDSILNINFPLEIKDISEKDKNNPFVDKNFKGIVV